MIADSTEVPVIQIAETLADENCTNTSAGVDGGTGALKANILVGGTAVSDAVAAANYSFQWYVGTTLTAPNEVNTKLTGATITDNA